MTTGFGHNGVLCWGHGLTVQLGHLGSRHACDWIGQHRPCYIACIILVMRMMIDEACNQNVKMQPDDMVGKD